MSDTDPMPWFLQRLALDAGADQRAIRRAYAREVKRIDQGADAEGFQLLREAYETALHWEEYQRYYAQQAENTEAAPRPAETPGPLTEAGPVPAAAGHEAGGVQAQPILQAAAVASQQQEQEQQPELRATSPATETAHPDGDALAILDIDPQQLSADVFEAFLAGCSGLAQGRTLHDAPAWELHLRTCLHDDRLMNLVARGIFEARVVHLLASGWRHGHETLLEAAADVFQWRSDRHRLRQFGHAGAIVDRAIDERSMFDNQDREQQAAQREVIARLRDADVPEAGQLCADMPHVEQLAVRFPTWLELVASMETVELWRTAYAALPEQLKQPVAPVAEAPAEPVAKPAGGSSAGKIVFWLLLLTAALRFINHVVDQPRTHTVPVPAAGANQLDAAPALAGQRTERQRQIEEKLRAAGTVPVTPPPSDQRLEEIRSRIRYRVTQMETPGKYTVKFKVQLDKQGRIEQVSLYKPSGLPLYDATVEKAIRDTPPFPPGTSPQFVLSYGLEIISRPVAPAREPAAPADPAAPETPPQ